MSIKIPKLRIRPTLRWSIKSNSTFCNSFGNCEEWLNGIFTFSSFTFSFFQQFGENLMLVKKLQYRNKTGWSRTGNKNKVKIKRPVCSICVISSTNNGWRWKIKSVGKNRYLDRGLRKSPDWFDWPEIIEQFVWIGKKRKCCSYWYLGLPHLKLAGSLLVIIDNHDYTDDDDN